MPRSFAALAATLALAKAAAAPTIATATPTFTQTVYAPNDACKTGHKVVTKIALSTSTSQYCVDVDNWGKVIATCKAGILTYTLFDNDNCTGHSDAGTRSWALGECVQGYGKSWMYTDCQETTPPLVKPPTMNKGAVAGRKMLQPMRPASGLPLPLGAFRLEDHTFCSGDHKKPAVSAASLAACAATVPATAFGFEWDCGGKGSGGKGGPACVVFGSAAECGELKRSGCGSRVYVNRSLPLPKPGPPPPPPGPPPPGPVQYSSTRILGSSQGLSRT